MTPTEAAFLPGLELSRILYEEAVRPVLDAAFPGLPYAAARIGPGSEVLGFDTARSADHDWGPRLDLFLAADDVAAHGEAIGRLLADRLPKEIRGWPTHFRPADDPLDPVGHMAATDGPVNHRVAVHDPGGWLTREAGFDASAAEPSVRDWLAMPQQRLAGITGGAVFHDGPGLLTAARRRLARYPEQVWRYLLACQWQRISQEEAFVGRCAEVGDELGSAVVAARQVRDLMRLSLLLERRYAPYSKWLGSAFAQLAAAEALCRPCAAHWRRPATRNGNGTSATPTGPSRSARTRAASSTRWTRPRARTTAGRSSSCTPNASPVRSPPRSRTRSCATGR